MKEQIISFKTSQMIKLVWNDLKESDVSHFYMKPNCGMLGIDEEGRYFIISRSKKGKLYKIGKEVTSSSFSNVFLAPTQSLLQKFIREKRGVHIEIHRNASGYYWSMCRADGGTDLGWSDHTGPNYGGVWDSFEDALENALQVQLSYDLPNDTKVIKHWGNYVEFALKSK